jgi:TonB family protein
LALLAALPSVLRAQSSCPAVDTVPPFAWCRVERRPVPRAENVIPSFPLALQTAQVEGEVRLELVVNENGEVEPASIELLRASHELFAETVRRAVQSWRFEPAEREGQWVKVRLALDVDFLLPPADSVPRREMTRIDSTNGGLRIRTGWESIPYEPGVAADSVAVYVIVANALRALAPANDASGAVCLAWRRARDLDLPPEVMTALSAAGSPLRYGAMCTAPEGTIVQQGASHGESFRRPRVVQRSPVSIDPLRVEIGDVRPWAPDVYTFRGNLSRGTNGWTYQCDARRIGTNAEWQTRCRRASLSVS